MDKSSYDAHILALYVAKRMNNINNEHVFRFNKWKTILHNFLFNHKFFKKLVIKSIFINICIILFWFLAFALIKPCRNMIFENICFGLSTLIGVLMLLYLINWLILMKLMLIYIDTVSKKHLVQKNMDQVRFADIQSVLSKVSQSSYALYNCNSIYVFNLTKTNAFWQNPYKLIAVCAYSNDNLNKILKLTDNVEFINNYAYICLALPLPRWKKLVINASKKLTQSAKTLQIKEYNLEIRINFIQMIAFLAIGTWVVYIMNGVFSSLPNSNFTVYCALIAQLFVILIGTTIEISIAINKHTDKRLMQKAKNNHTLQKTSYLIETPDYYLQPIIGKVNAYKKQYQTIAVYAYHKTPENLMHLHPKEIKQSIVYDYTNLLPDCVQHF